MDLGPGTTGLLSISDTTKVKALGSLPQAEALSLAVSLPLEFTAHSVFYDILLIDFSVAFNILTCLMMQLYRAFSKQNIASCLLKLSQYSHG